ncbi:MAG: DUF1292 domain-containing protein [Lachnospiraceae bacterium]|nr:DUF1292 domain-containing protein [Lachnospiraceae bacterium]
MEDLREDEFEIITVTDEETGEDIDFAIIDSITFGGNEYVLVVEAEFIDDEESEAAILKKEIRNGEEFYGLVEDDTEFDAVADLFSAEGEEYDIEK